MSEAREKVVEMLNKGEPLGKIEGYLRFIEDMSTNGAKDFLKEVRVELGHDIGSGATADWSETVEFLRANVDKLEKKELINGMCEINGKTYNTNQHAYNYIHMAQEWARQAVESES